MKRKDTSEATLESSESFWTLVLDHMIALFLNFSGIFPMLSRV